MDLREVRYEGVDCMHLTQDGEQWPVSCERDNERSGSIMKGEEYID
jgi:hypothetical protein